MYRFNHVAASSLLLVLLSICAASAMTAPPRASAVSLEREADLAAGGQYTAILDQAHNRWRILPFDGQDVEVDAGTCRTGASVPGGYWLLMLDASGQPELIAPSITEIPAGQSERIPVRTCAEVSEGQLGVPQTVLDLLVANTGGIYVRR